MAASVSVALDTTGPGITVTTTDMSQPEDAVITVVFDEPILYAYAYLMGTFGELFSSDRFFPTVPLGIEQPDDTSLLIHIPSAQFSPGDTLSLKLLISDEVGNFSTFSGLIPVYLEPMSLYANWGRSS